MVFFFINSLLFTTDCHADVEHNNIHKPHAVNSLNSKLRTGHTDGPDGRSNSWCFWRPFSSCLFSIFFGLSKQLFTYIFRRITRTHVHSLKKFGRRNSLQQRRRLNCIFFHKQLQIFFKWLWIITILLISTC